MAKGKKEKHLLTDEDFQNKEITIMDVVSGLHKAYILDSSIEIKKPRTKQPRTKKPKSPDA